MLDMKKITTASTDEEFANLGFSCLGQVCEIPGHEDEYERNWLLRNEDGDQIVINDQGNGYSSFVRVFEEENNHELM